MRNIYIALFLISISIHSQTPGGIETTNMSLWLNGDDYITNVTDLEWVDKIAIIPGGTDTGYKAFQPLEDNKPVQTNLFNYHQSFTFDGGNDYLAIQGLSYESGTILTNVCAFVVYKTNYSTSNYNNNWSFVDFDRSDAYSFYVHGNGRLAMSFRDGVNDPSRVTNRVVDIEAVTPSNNDVPHIGTFIIDNTTTNQAQLRLDGFEDKVEALVDDVNVSANRFGFIGDGSEANAENGSRNNIYYDGDIAEVILIDKGAITATEILHIESYLALKYGITLDNSAGTTAGDYIYDNGSTVTVVWDADVNNTYHHNVAALIKADNYDLDQKIATPVSGDLIVSVDEDFTSENSDIGRNSISGVDGEFLFFGNNNLSGFEVFETTEAILKKIWLFKENLGSTDDYYIAIPKDAFPPDATNVRMLVSTDNVFNTVDDALITQETNIVTPDHYYFKTNINNNDKVSFIFNGISDINEKIAGVAIDRFDIVLRADKDLVNNGSSLTWEDGGLYAVNGFQNTSNRIPNTTNLMNFNPTLSFDGTRDYIALQNKKYDQGDILEKVHGFVVYSTDFNDSNANDLSGNWSFIDFDRSEAYNFYIVPDGKLAISYQSQGTRDLESASLGNDGLPHIAEFVINADLEFETFMKFDGLVEFNSDLTTSGILVDQDRYGFIGDGSEASSENGGRNGTYYDGQISEVLLSDRESFTAEETLKIESYLALKYGVSLNSSLGTYLNSSYDGSVSTTDGVLWDNATYWHGVAGIIKDDVISDLDQRIAQSTSFKDIIVSTALDFTSGNLDHANRTTPLTEGSSLLFGNDGAGTGYTSFVGGASDEYITARKWMFKEVGTNTGTVFVAIAKSYFPEDAYNVKYLISPDDVFSSADSPVAVLEDGDYYYFTMDIVDASRLAFTFTLDAVPSPGAYNDGLQMWLKSDKNVDSSNGIITSVSDSGINSHDVSQSTNLDKPSLLDNGDFNFNPSISFDGTADHLAINDLSFMASDVIQKIYAWVVYKTDNEDANNGSFLSFDGTEYFDLAVAGGASGNLEFSYKPNGGAAVVHTGATDTNNGNVKIAGFIQDEDLTNATVIRLNGTEELANNTNDSTIGNSTESRFGFVGDKSIAENFDGGNTGDYYDGDIAEIIYYQDQAVSIENILKIESYLGLKYGVTVPGNYVNSNYVDNLDTPNILWDATANAAYHNNVIGLVRDDGSELEQKQSKSTEENSVLTISSNNGSIATNNSSIAGTFSNLDYLIVGHNGGADPLTLVDEANGVGNCLRTDKKTDRDWLVNASGSFSNLTLSFDLSTLPDPDNYELIVDNDGDFTSGIISTTPGVITGNEVVFTGVTLADGNIFTLANVEMTGEIIYGNGVWFGCVDTALSTDDTGKSVQILESVTLPDNALCECMSIVAAAIVTVSDGNYLHLEDELELYGDLYLEGTSELIQTKESGDPNLGDGNLHKIINEATSSVFRYNYFASPVHTAGEFSIGSNLKINNGPTLGDNITPGFIDNDLEGFGTTFSTRWFHTLNNDVAFTEINESTTMVPGVGFTMKGTSMQNDYNFIGVPNNGVVDIPLTEDRFLLTGNPYPSTISVAEFNNVNGGLTDSTIYLWDHPYDDGDHSDGLIDTAGGYATIVNGITVAAATLNEGGVATQPSLYIKPGQGFIVYGAATGTVSFNNSMRAGVTYDGTRHFFKTEGVKTIGSDKPIIRLGFEYKTADNRTYHRQLVTALEGGTLQKEAGKDAYMFDYYNNDAYWVVDNESSRFIITSVPTLSDDLELPVGVVLDTEKEVTFKVDDLEFVTNNVYILDKKQESIHKISTTETYTTTVDSGDNQDRFSLVFKEEVLLDSEIIDSVTKTVLYVQNQNLHVVLENGSIEKIDIYNLRGQVIVSKEYKDHKNNTSIDLSNSLGQLLVVKIVTSKGMFTKKIIID